VGFMDRCPYGYNYAEQYGCELDYSEDKREGLLSTLLRGLLRIALGYDLLHAFRNRRKAMGADVIWTHTESQYLAILTLKKVLRLPIAAKIIGQSIWLIDQWDNLPLVQRALYRWLIGGIDLLTFHSSLNLAVARKEFPSVPSTIVRYGITSAIKRSKITQNGSKLRLLALGNDRHRDWETLLTAVKELDFVDLTIASSGIPRRIAADAGNVTIARPQSIADIEDLYGWADAVIVPLKPNKHASGITVMLEAASLALPIVATDVGGVSEYFGKEDVIFVPPHNVAAIKDVIIRLSNMDTKDKTALGEKARSNIKARDLNSVAFARQHAELSHLLLGRDWLRVSSFASLTRRIESSE
jgi:glycosyltransferase involved in cell wall biosynthesis